MTTNSDGTALEQPADDIKSALAAAMIEVEASETPEIEESGESAPARTRGADGKFAKPEVETAEAVVAQPVAASAPEVAKPDAPLPAAVEPPVHWSENDKTMFKGIPANAQTFLIERHKAMEADYTRKTQQIADFRREYEPVDQLFQPHREKMIAGGWTPRKMIEAWAAVEQRFMNGDGINAIRDIARGYNIDLSQAAIAPANGQPPVIDPALLGVLNPLQAEMRKMSGWVQQQQQAEANRVADQNRRETERHETEVRSKIDEISSFIATKDDKGQPANPYYSEVEDDMVLRAQALQAAGHPVPSLKELYDYAVFANPTTRARLLAAITQTEQSRTAEQARAKAVAAKKAGSSVTGAPGTGQSAHPKGVLSLREQLAEAADNF